nr:ABC transporter ATP-binding protein [Devosia ureilytica]
MTIRFGGHAAVNNVTCAFHPGELTVIVGPNGAGKTTWFNLVSGQLRPSEGRVVLGERDITALSPSGRARAGIGRAFQLTTLFPKLSVFENVRLAVQARAGQGHRLFIKAAKLPGLADKAMHFLEQTNLASVADLPAAALPHGDQRKLEVAMLLAMEPDIFMFDEPTAGMSVDEAPVILDLIARIKEDKARTVLLVEHKMDVVRALADRIVVLHNGELVTDGEPAEVMALDLVREIYLGVGADEVA